MRLSPRFRCSPCPPCRRGDQRHALRAAVVRAGQHQRPGRLDEDRRLDAAIVANSGSAAAVFGQQSLRISNATTSGSFGDQTFSAPLVDGAGEATSVNGGQAGGERQPHFDTTFQFMSADPAAVQTGLAVTVSPDSGNGGRMSFLRLRDMPAGLAIDFIDVRPETDAEHVDFREVEIAQGLDRRFRTPSGSRWTSSQARQRRRQGLRRRPAQGHRLVVGGLLPQRYRERPGQRGSGRRPVALARQLGRAAGEPGKGFLIDDVSSRSYGGPGGATGPPVPMVPLDADGATGPPVRRFPRASPAPTAAQGPAGTPGADPPSAKPVRVSILSSRLNRNTGVASLRLRCPARAGSAAATSR